MLEKVKKILSNEVGIDEQEITIKSDLIYDLGIQSMDLYCIFEAVEEEFQIKIPQDTKVITVEDIINVVQNNVK